MMQKSSTARESLCFQCDERYTTSHHCKSRDQHELRILLVSNNAEEFEIFYAEDESSGPVELQQTTMEHAAVVELSLSSVVDLTNLGTMKLHGSIRTKGMIVLIDCGANHNFISQRIVDLLKLSVVDTMTICYSHIVFLS